MEEQEAPEAVRNTAYRAMDGRLALKRIRLYALGLATAMAGLSPAVHALPGDPVEFIVGANVVRDSNVFRLSDGATIPGTGDKSDTRTVATAGINFDVPISRQRLQGGLIFNDNRYRQFSELDYTDRELRALWSWQVGSTLSGQVGFSNAKSLASFNNFRDRLPNPFELRRSFANAAWMMTPSWRLQGALLLQEHRNGLTQRRENDLDWQSPELTLSYVTPANNSLGLSLRDDRGRYPTRQVLAGTPINNDYRQQRVGVVTEWAFTGKSRINARIDRLQREYEQLSQRDYDGTTMYAAYELRATEKFSLSAIAQREISMGEDIQTSLVLIKGFTLRPTWDVTQKIRIAATADYSVRDYLSDPAVALGLASNREDRVRMLSATVFYRPLQTLTLSLTAQREVRSSNQPLTDYTDNVLSLGARLAF